MLFTYYTSTCSSRYVSDTISLRLLILKKEEVIKGRTAWALNNLSDTRLCSETRTIAGLTIPDKFLPNLFLKLSISLTYFSKLSEITIPHLENLFK